jgi:hypothetical protein
MLVHFKARDLTGLVDNDPIVTLTDVSGNGNDGVQATSTKRATYRTNIINGWPVIRFDGTDDEYDDTTFAGLAGVAGMTAFATVIIANGVTERRLSQRASQFDLRFRTDIANDEIAFGLQTSVGYTVLRTATAMSYGVPQRIAWVYDGTNNYIRREGVQEATAAKTGTVATGSGDHIIGGTLALDLIELLIYASALSAGQITDTETYLAGEYAAAVAGSRRSLALLGVS